MTMADVLEVPMNRLLASCLVVPLLLSSPVFAQTKAKAQNVPEIPYESVPNFLKLPPGLYLGEAMGVATNSKGHLFVYTRSANTRLFEFDQNGKYVREIGEGNYGFEFAHSVRVDPEDNIWAVDEGTNMVIKFNPAGRVVMVLGHRPDAVVGLVAQSPAPNVPAEKYILGRPTDVAWDAQGNIFVSDGYINHRVVKYDKNGRFLKQVGSEKPGSEPSQFNTPHGIAVDAQGNVYVADRANHRMQVFDNNLERKAIYDNIGDSWTVCISPGPHQYLFTSNSNPNGNTPGSWDITGEIYKMELDGTILGRFGHASKELGGFQVVHMMDCRNPNEIVVAEIESWRVQKLILKPPASKGAGAK
jgi:DNA-binding beta-propeller fold protein YncE